MINENEIPKVIEDKISDNCSKFVIEPLYPGYGSTIGNALRRVLLSSLSGVAITYVKLDEVTHEFSTIPHVKEDMMEIIMNLRQIVFKSQTKEPVTIELTAKGAKNITAADFKPNSKIEILNPDQKIATLDNKATFNLEVTIENGRGFQPSEDKSVDNLSIGKIAIDSVFSPVKLVNFHIDRARVGKMTNYDKIELEIRTNGTVTPKEALTFAGKILVEYFSFIGSGKSYDFNSEPEISELIGTNTQSSQIEDISCIDPKTKIEEINLSARTVNSLVNSGIRTIAGLKRLSDLKISEIKGLGKKGFLEIKELLGR
ncbi:MAG: DNA-directed RNA polymerase subunit alpha [Candidatus Berkelbacteria bacterium Athens1014_28]|uniref:DNA-directed RNA polymerase subunit alpha n=1 Tax=Candidatus Berkelbacteria bacterium Athens1014_28 TaxID=2017145 RepID=A0A554LR16_9BACT|nr:MAG: DNA-directed RNA polymerase subunit alpha [Candidatus Berkelbacteria bacterium Athens1014_28]